MKKRGKSKKSKKVKNVIIMGAAGRDFHNFNVYFKKNRNYRVVAFTAEQIPGIARREYPPKLAGRRYPDGIPIFPEEKLPKLIKDFDKDCRMSGLVKERVVAAALLEFLRSNPTNRQQMFEHLAKYLGGGKKG